MKRAYSLPVALVCLALLVTRGYCAAPTPAPATSTALTTSTAPAVSVNDLLDSLYPGGVPTSASDVQKSNAHSANNHATPTLAIDRGTSGSSPTAVLVPAGTLVVRRSNKPAVHLEGTTLTQRLSSATTTTTTTRTVARDARTTHSVAALRVPSAGDQTAMVRLDGLEKSTTTATLHTATLHTTTTAAVQLPPLDTPPNPDGVWINRATQLELEHKLKLDARRARLILEFRKTFGPFKDPDDLTQVTGITDDMVKVWESNDLLFFD